MSERPSRGGVERTYGVVESAATLTAQQLEAASDDDHIRYFATFLGTLLSDFGAYLAMNQGGGRDLTSDGVGYRQAPLWLDDDELTELVEQLRAVVEPHLANGPTPGRRRRLLSTIVMPDDRP
ncbi:MAG: hypothetical protein AAF467_10910 [Actinomycetota bacterium]